jgi:inorganic pyrophosphatase
MAKQPIKQNKVNADEKIVLEVTIEIPKDSKIKYEFDRKSGKIKIDRILYGPNSYPQNYGFIPEALD